MKIKRILEYAGYILAFFISLYISIFLTLPDEQIAQYVIEKYIKPNGVNVIYKSVGITPTMNIVFKEAEIELMDNPQKVNVDRLEAGVSVFGFIIGDKPFMVKADVYGGSIKVGAGAKKEKISLSIDMSDLDMMKLDILKEKTGINFKGLLNLTADIKYDGKESKNNNGGLSIAIKSFEIKGGKIMGFEIPSVNLGDLKGDIEIKEGKFKVSNFKSKGKDVELRLVGDGSFQSPPSRSNLNLSLKVKLNQAFIDREEKLKTILFGIGSSLDKEGFYNFAIKGTLSNPSFNLEKNK